MDIFASCQEVNDLFERGDEVSARNVLIRLLSDIERQEAPYPSVVNQLIRVTGLYPYLQLDTASWDQKFVYQAFAVDVGRTMATLHREQSVVLAKLMAGVSLAINAPTSFGKSFIIDAFIAAQSPRTVVIIVPTIALMDETRRRIYKKFGNAYNVVTTADMPLTDKNIFIFPQERVFSYLEELRAIDLLVIDEFYKASVLHDKERAPSLLRAIIQLSGRSKQRYYLSPNIKRLA